MTAHADTLHVDSFNDVKNKAISVNGNMHHFSASSHLNKVEVHHSAHPNCTNLIRRNVTDAPPNGTLVNRNARRKCRWHRYSGPPPDNVIPVRHSRNNYYYVSKHVLRNDLGYTRSRGRCAQLKHNASYFHQNRTGAPSRSLDNYYAIYATKEKTPRRVATLT